MEASMRSHSWLGVLLLISGCVAADATPIEDHDDDDGTDLAYPSNRSQIDYSGSTSGLYYGGGEILTSSPTNLYFIFYGPNWTADQMNILGNFARDLSGSPMANVLTTYTDDGADGAR